MYELILEIINYSLQNDLHWQLNARLLNKRQYFAFKKTFNNWCKYVRDKVCAKIGRIAASQLFAEEYEITGGFLVDCIYDINRFSDIDVVKNGICLKSIDSSEHLGTLFAHKLLCEDYIFSYSATDSKQFTVAKFCKLDISIDIICVSLRTELQFINGFDFGFCRNAFNGQRLKIHDMDSVMNKYYNVDYITIEKCFAMRDYMRTDADFASAIYENLVSRCEKYRKSGFIVNLPENLRDMIDEKIMDYEEQMRITFLGYDDEI